MDACSPLKSPACFSVREYVGESKATSRLPMRKTYKRNQFEMSPAPATRKGRRETETEEEEEEEEDEESLDTEDPEPSSGKFGDLKGDFRQYPADETEPHPGIGKKNKIDHAAKCFLNAEHRNIYHPVTPSLVFLCYLIPGLWSALKNGGVPISSFLSQPLNGHLQTQSLTNENIEDTPLTALELSAVIAHCTTLLIGVILGSSAKISAGSIQIKKRLMAMFVTLGKPTHFDTANILQLFPPTHAIDWINSQPWAGNLVFGLLSTSFESPVKEMMGQLKMVAEYAQMTTYQTIRSYLDQCMDGTIALPSVAKEIEEFIKVAKEVKRKLENWFKYAGAIRHSEAILLAPKAFPNLATAALYWSKRESTSMGAYKAPDIIPGATITEFMLARARKRGIVRMGAGIKHRQDLG